MEPAFPCCSYILGGVGGWVGNFWLLMCIYFHFYKQSCFLHRPVMKTLVGLGLSVCGEQFSTKNKIMCAFDDSCPPPQPPRPAPPRSQLSPPAPSQPAVTSCCWPLLWGTLMTACALGLPHPCLQPPAAVSGHLLVLEGMDGDKAPSYKASPDTFLLTGTTSSSAPWGYSLGLSWGDSC